MNIFFEETSSKLGKDFLKGICSKIPSIKKVFLINYLDVDQPKINGVEVITICKEEASNSNYTNIDLLTPVDKRVFDDLNLDSLHTFKMIERIGKFKGSDNYDERSNMYFNHIKFWNHMIEFHKIEMSIFMNVPHEPSTFIIHQLMKIKKKITLYQEQLHFLDTYTIEKNIKISKPKKYKLENILFENAKSTVFQFRKPSYTPFYFKNWGNNLNDFNSKIKKFNYILNEIISKKKFFSYVNYKLKGIFIKRKILNFLKKNQIKPDLNKKYIFIPLHYQPEASTSPKGDIFVYQNLMIQMIANALKETDWLIYVKEHPYQNPLFGRSFNFYSRINNLKNVFLIKNNVPSRNILLKSKAVGIVTGTMGLEAISNQIPVLCFGDIYYKFLHGVFPIESNKDINLALEKIKNNFKPDLEKLIVQLNKIPANYYHGYTNYEYEEVSKIPYAINLKNLVENLFSHLSSLEPFIKIINTKN